MPNHVTNILEIITDDAELLKTILEKISSSEKHERTNEDIVKHIDFNKIIPMPSTLMITCGSNVDNAIAVLEDDQTKFQEMLEWPWVQQEGLRTTLEVKNYLSSTLRESDFEEARMSIMNVQLYGTKNWYDWCIKNWDTKWNAYDQSLENNIITFDTAWSTPFSVILQLSAQFPKAIFKVDYADEDIGHNCGRYVLQSGLVIEEYEPESGNEAIKFANKIKGNEDDSFIDDFLNEDDQYVTYHEDDLREMFENDEENSLLELISHPNMTEVKKGYISDIALEYEKFEFLQAFTKKEP